MVPPPSSIVTHAELQRLDLLRLERQAELAGPVFGPSPSVVVIATLRRIVIPATRTILATLALRPRVRTVRPA